MKRDFGTKDVAHSNDCRVPDLRRYAVGASGVT